MLGVKRERDKAIEAAGFVLKLAQSNQMIDTFLEGFDVAIEHRCIRSNTHLVNRSRDLEPSRARNLMSGDKRPRAFRKDFGAATGTAAHSGFMELLDHPFEGLTRDLAEKIDFDHRERFQVHRRESIFQTT